MLNKIRFKLKKNFFVFNSEEFLLLCLLSSEATPIALFLQRIAIPCLDVLCLKEECCFKGRIYPYFSALILLWEYRN